jgi:Protein of unknown function (DUF4031)
LKVAQPSISKAIENAMTVYVHKLRGQSGLLNGATPNDPWFGLTADTEDELHAFAARLGLQPSLFQPGAPTGSHQVSVSGHYDVTEGERDRAVALGAQAITAREEDKRERRLRHE